MRFIFLIVCSVFTLLVSAQKMADPKPFANSITEADLKKHLYIVASKEFEGRETATEGQRKAAAYIEAQFKSMGLQPGNQGDYELHYPVYKDSLINATLEIGGKSFSLMQDFDVYMSNYSASFPAAEVVFAGYGVSDSSGDDYEGLDVKGKIVLVISGMPPARLQAQVNSGTFRPFGKLDAAQKHGAVAMLSIQAEFPRKETTVKGTMSKDIYRKVINPDIFYVSENVARAIMGADYDAAKAGQIRPKTYKLPVLMEFYKTTTKLQSSDVLGFLEGTDLKDQVLVVSAHYDHIGKQDTVINYGADDDGSGTVSVLEIAEAFSKAKAAGKGPRRSILFLANSGEEKGLWGSEYYSDHPAYPLDKTTADLNIDMIGRIDPNRKKGDSTNYIYVVGDDKLSSELKPISEATNKKYSKLELDYKFNDPKDPLRIYYRSDHYNFARKGVPVIFYFDGIHNDYHRPTDTPDKINYDILAKRAKFVFYTAWEMANRDGMIKRDIPL